MMRRSTLGIRTFEHDRSDKRRALARIRRGLIPGPQLEQEIQHGSRLFPVNIWNTDGQLPADFHQGHYALTNLLYYPVKKVMVGGEFQFGRRVNFSDGFNTNDYKVQVSFKYNYSKMLTY